MEIYVFSKHGVIQTRSNIRESDSVGKQHIIKFEAAEALYILKYIIVQESKHLFLNSRV